MAGKGIANCGGATQLVQMNYVFANSAGSIPGAILFARKLDREVPGHERVYYFEFRARRPTRRRFNDDRQKSRTATMAAGNTRSLLPGPDYHGTTLAALFGPSVSRSGWSIRPAWRPVRDVVCRILPRISQPVHRRRELCPAAANGHRGGGSCARGPDTVGGLCLEPITAGGGVITRPRGIGTGAGESAPTSTISCCISTGRLRRGAAPGAGSATSIYGVKPDFRDHGGQGSLRRATRRFPARLTTEAVFRACSRTILRPDVIFSANISTFWRLAPRAGGGTSRTCGSSRTRTLIREHASDWVRRMMDNSAHASDKHAVSATLCAARGLSFGAELRERQGLAGAARKIWFRRWWADWHGRRASSSAPPTARCRLQHTCASRRR